MNKLYIKIGSALLLSASLCSCGDFLEPKAKSEFVPKDAQSLNELLLGEAYPLTSDVYLEGFLNLLDDDVTGAPYQSEYTGFRTTQRTFGPFSWQGNMWFLLDEESVSMNMYSSLYRKIKGCNAVLDYIGQVNDSKEEIDNVLAQAHALRGLYYLYLVNMFGQPYQMGADAMGVPLKKTSEIENKTLERNTVGEVYDFILADLHAAEELYEGLPESRHWSASFRTNLPMVQLLLSRTYLYLENWEKAAEYGKKILDNPQFQYRDLNKIATHREDYPSLRAYATYHTYSSPEVMWVYGNVGDMNVWLTQYSNPAENVVIRSCFRASDELLATFDQNPYDLRRERYIVRSWYETTQKDAFGKTVVDGMPQAIGKVPVSQQYTAVSGNSNFARSIRLPEACLNYAEAKVMLGDNSEALRVVNEMRRYRFASRRYKEVTEADCTEGVLKFIRDERRRELCFEGHRWFDLRRTGMPEIKHVIHSSEDKVTVYTLKQNDPLYTIPVPDRSMELNGSLKQIPLGDVPRVGEEQDYQTLN